MRPSRLAKGTSIAVALATLLGGCASVEPDWEQNDEWYKDVEPLSKQNSEGAVYDSRRHGLLLGVGNKYNIGDLIVVKVDESTNSVGAVSNNQTKESRHDTGFSYGMDGEIGIEGELGFNSGSQFKGSGKTQKSHSLTGDITVVVRRVMPNGNLVVEGRKEVELSNGREVIGMRGIIRESDISTASNSIPSSKVANAHIYYKGAGDSESSSSQGIMSKATKSKWWIF